MNILVSELLKRFRDGKKLSHSEYILLLKEKQLTLQDLPEQVAQKLSSSTSKSEQVITTLISGLLRMCETEANRSLSDDPEWQKMNQEQKNFVIAMIFRDNYGGFPSYLQKKLTSELK